LNLTALTQTQAAALLSVAPRTLRDWHDAPRNGDSTYSGPALVAFYVAKMAGSGEFDDQRQRLAAAQAEKVEHENAVRRGDLAPRADVVRFWTDCIANMRAKALGMGSKLSPRLVNIADPNIIATAIRTEVYAFLADLADYEPSGPADMVEGGAESSVTAAGADSKPVGRPRKKAQQRKQRGAGAVADG
jgi:hypothetical protein